MPDGRKDFGTLVLTTVVDVCNRICITNCKGRRATRPNDRIKPYKPRVNVRSRSDGHPRITSERERESVCKFVLGL